MRVSPILMCLAVASLALTSSSAVRAAEPSGEPYDLHAILSLSGPGAYFGANAGKTMKVIENVVNQQGGVHGRPLRIVLGDDQTSPQVAVQLTNDLIAQKVPIILGPTGSANCLAAAPLLMKAGPVQYCVSPFIDPPAGSYQFSNGPTGANAASVVLHYFRLRGMSRVAMLSTTDAPGLEMEKATTAALKLAENSAVQMVARQEFAPNDLSVAAQVAAIKAANPQALIVWNAAGPALGTALRAAHNAGLDVPIMLAGSSMTLSMAQQLSSVLPKEFLFVVNPAWITNVAVPKRVAEAQKAMRSAFDAAGIKPDGGYISVYDLTMMAVDALRKLPPDPTAAQMHDYLIHLHDWAGANAIYDFPAFPQRGIGEDGYLIARYDPAKEDFVGASKPGGIP